MSRLNELIKQYCPDGVEYKKLGEICLKVCSGGTPSRGNSDYFTGDIPWLRTQEVDWKDIYDTEIKITEDAVKNSSAKLIPENCVIIAMYGATAGKVGINKIPLTTNQACCNLQINPQKALYKYVYYWVCNEYEHLKSLGQGSQNNINAQIIKEYPIPVPPLPVQEEIVRILDNFAELQAELEAELQADLQKRLQQYNYYRNRLLSFNELNRGQSVSVEWKKLGDIAQYAKERVNSSLISTHTYVSVENLLQNKEGKKDASTVPSGSLIKYEKGDILIGNIRPYLKKIWLADIDGGTNGDVLTIRITDKDIISSYLYHILASDAFFLYDMSYAKGAKMPRGDKTAVMNYIVPVPPLAEQKRIVDILDRFDKLTTNITASLPAEIEARRKQYEYYRDQLLTFKQKAS